MNSAFLCRRKTVGFRVHTLFRFLYSQDKDVHGKRFDDAKKGFETVVNDNDRFLKIMIVVVILMMM